MSQTFTELVQAAKKILVAGHLTPDYDAYTCMLFTYNIVKQNFPEKEIHMNLDTKEPFARLSFLPNFGAIEYGDLIEKIKTEHIDLLILVDGSTNDRFTSNFTELEAIEKNIKTVLIDHHKVEETHFDLFYNLPRGSGIEVVYDLLVRQEHLELFEGWQETYLTGMIGDSYRFYYPYPGYRENFAVVSDILDQGKWTIREISDRLFSYAPDEMKLLSLLFRHVVIGGKYVYTALTWDEYKKEIQGKISLHEYKKARRFFIDTFLNQVEGYSFCFTLVPDENVNDGITYSGSFRSRPNTYDCTKLALKLAGGGHVTGAGFVVVAPSIEDAMKQVTDLLDKELEAARVIS